MRWLKMLVIGLAPLLSFADSVDGAPAGALKAANSGAHRRALVDTPGSPWHRRYADSRRQVSADPITSDPGNVVDGPPPVITVPAAADTAMSSSSDTGTSTDTTTTPTDATTAPTDITTTSSSDTSSIGPTSTDTTSSTNTDTTTSTSTSTDTATATTTSDTSSSSTSTDNGGINISIAPLLDSTTTTTTTTTTPPPDTPTDVPTTSTDTSTTPTTTDPPADVSTSSNTPAEVPTTTSTPTDVPTTTSTPTDVPTTTDTTTSTSSFDPLSIIDSLGLTLPTLGGTDSTTTDAPTDTPISIPPIDPTNSTVADPPITTTSPPIDLPTDPPVSTPTTTSISSSSSAILSIPGDLFPNVTVASTGDPTTDVDTTTTKPPITIESQYQFITATSFLISPSVSTSTAAITNTDPDAVLTSNSLQSAGPSATVTSAVIPSTIPMFITPPVSSDHVPPGTVLDGYTEISILFQSAAGWMWILQSSETAAQILAYMPPILYTSLDCAPTDVKTIGLSAFEPADTASADDLMTMWVGLIKTELVSTLSAMIHTPTSEFYNTGDPVAQSIAKTVVAAYNIATITGVSNEDGAPSTTSGTTVVDNSRRNAIIGVSTAFGLIALAVFVWWVVKTYKARREGAHKRLSYGNTPNYGAAGAGVAAGVGGGYGAGGDRADSPPMIHNPFLTEREREEEARGIRRNSFYAIGPDDASIEEETFDYMSQHSGGGGGGSNLNRAGSNGSGGGRWVTGSGGLTVPGAGGNVGNAGGYVRRPVVGQPISQPILRESSMGNW